MIVGCLKIIMFLNELKLTKALQVIKINMSCMFFDWFVFLKAHSSLLKSYQMLSICIVIVNLNYWDLIVMECWYYKSLNHDLL